MKTLRFEQFLPITLDEAWSFFSSPANLNVITPPEMQFKILSEVPATMHKDLIIRYRIQPMMRIGMRWVTRISDVEHGVFFIDEQIKGPYKLWRHEHRFEAKEGGVLMTDILSYDIGLGPLGWIAGKVWVDKQVKGIFAFRNKKLEDIFGK
jgi:ligand-binding SRPBCC domain-containing protein